MLDLPRKMRPTCSHAAPAFAWRAQHLEGLSLILPGRRSPWRTSVSFCPAGAARRASPERSAEVRRRLTHIDSCGRRLRLPQHLEHFSVILHGRRSVGAPQFPASTVFNRRRTSADLFGGALCAAPAIRHETGVLHVLRLPRKHSRRPQYSIVAGLPRISLEVTMLCTVLNRRRTSADLSGDALRAAPATQNETEVR